MPHFLGSGSLLWLNGAYVLPLLINAVQQCLYNIKRNNDGSRDYLRDLNTRSYWSTTGLYVNNNEFPDYIAHHDEHKLPKIRILLIGDSLDRNIVTALCNERNQTHWTYNVSKEGEYLPNAFQPENFTVCSPQPRYFNSAQHKICTTSTLSIANMFHEGVLREDSDGHCFRTRMTRAWQFLKESPLFSKEPDLVIFKSFYWDIQCLCGLGQPYADGHLPTSIIQTYHDRTIDAMKDLRQMFPSSFIAMKIEPMWNHQSNRFTQYIGNASMAHTLSFRFKNVFRYLSERCDYPLLDYSRIFEEMDFKKYLNDDVHPNDFYSTIIGQTIVGLSYALKGQKVS